MLQAIKTATYTNEVLCRASVAFRMFRQEISRPIYSQEFVYVGRLERLSEFANANGGPYVLNCLSFDHGVRLTSGPPLSGSRFRDRRSV